MATRRDIHHPEFEDDEPDLGKRMIKEIAKCGKRMRFELNSIILLMAPIAIFIIVFVVIEYVLLIQYFGD
jgi:hypothetical protein